MPIDPEYSLVRYDPYLRTLAHRTDGHRQQASAPAETIAHRSVDRAPASPIASPLRRNHPHSVYSPRLTLAAALTGRVIDIFV
jgi:hypothetical protein